MKFEKGILTELGASDESADRYLEQFNIWLPKGDIVTHLRRAHFLAQIFHESSRLQHMNENLNYSIDGLLKVFPKYFPNRSLAIKYARQPVKIANRVYANRMGNGLEESGDGWKFRGRGAIQLTGKKNYVAFSTWAGVDFISQPGLVSGDYAIASAVYYWTENGLNALADKDDVNWVTRKINGGLNGIDDRIAMLKKAKHVLTHYGI